MSLKKKAKIERSKSSTPSIFSSHMETLSRLSSLSQGLCIVGAMCSGKSSLIRSLATDSEKHILTVYMDSSIDSKNLIGTYVCSDIPGEFIWKTGILAHAAETGSWIVFENLDRMSEDILTLLTNTILTKQIQVPNKPTPIVPAPGFKIFGTACTEISQSSSWIQYKIPEIDLNAFTSIVQVPQSNEDVLKKALVAVHEELDKLGGRKLLLSDWKKFVSRAEFQIKRIYGQAVPAALTEKVRELLFLEALAVYSAVRDTNSCVKVLCLVLNLNEAMARAMADNRIVQVKVRDQVLQVGISPEIHTTQINSANFSINSYSARLLETLCSAISFNENLLLIGETGCGKTSIIQYLARFTNTKLYVHNLSQTSDPTDIVGGFKPVALSSIMLPLLTSFLKSTYPIEGEDHSATAAAKQLFSACKWEKFLKSLDLALSSLAFDLPTKEDLQDSIDNCRKKLKNSQFAFSFEEGSLVKAIKEGSWVLLEEINLAEEEVLERLYSVLEGQGLTLIEKGETQSIAPAPGFRLFGCMNPGKQVGKKDLPSALRCKFSEFQVPDMEKPEDIMEVINFYLNGKTDRKTMEKITSFYLQMRKLSKEGLVEDGNGRPPCYTLRTLCRALKYSLAFSGHYSFPHSLYNGLKVFFETPLKTSISNMLQQLIPGQGARVDSSLEKTHINVLGYYHEKGPNSGTDPNFILTPSVKANLQALSRAVIYSNNSILLEGPTSSGKTSMVKYLAQVLGHEFVRINNHEHTDIEEYIGSYISDNSGRLVFCEGPLVKAVKNGYFLVLDELNLAPSEVLEALNRLLDDNQELFIPETQTTIKPHKNFRLFATQNPTAYAGRKELSKAFRNRFVEMFIPELPDEELVSILQIKGKMAPSYANVLISVMRDLQRHRQQTRAFMGKYGFITIRDLLKIAKREPVGYEQLAHFTYLLLAERLRTEEERKVVQEVVERYCKGVKVNMEKFYLEYFEKEFNGSDCGIVWNFHMKRLFTLVHSAVLCKEPVLLIGETGCGKTSICSALASHNSKVLRTLNCHQHTETSDFLGSLRPVRARTFLISQFFSVLSNYTTQQHEVSESSLKTVLSQIKSDEIRLDPSVKPQLLNQGKRCLKLFEWVDGPLVESFLSGDYFLIDEISLADDSVLERLNSVLEAERSLLIPEKPSEDHLEVQAHEGFAVFATMNPGGDYGKKELSPALRNRFTEIWVSLSTQDMEEILKSRIRDPSGLVGFISKYNESCPRVPLSLRDAITCADFMNRVQVDKALDEALALVLPNINVGKTEFKIRHFEGSFGIEPFFIGSKQEACENYSFTGPTIVKNLYSLLRAMQLPKAVLLEGPPGVGKTSIIEALGKVVGQSVVRVNLSEETDLIDLLGCDLPVGDKFEWCDGVLLDAIKNGKWVILDELNLCPQQVIEGLNGLLDHRHSVFIPEINLEVKCAKEFRVFAAQNPVNQGGGRKGLPKSFLNRFTKIYMEDLTELDYVGILDDLFCDEDNKRIVRFSQGIRAKVAGPWEFNLRDILRAKAGARISSLYWSRLRNNQQRKAFEEVYEEVFNEKMVERQVPFFYLTPEKFYIQNLDFDISSYPSSFEMLPKQLSTLSRILEISSFKWPILLVGPSGSGKSSIFKMAGSLLSVKTVEFTLSPNTDSSTLLGSFEQNDLGQFAWFDSFLLKSIKQGDWVLLKKCNKSNAAVLDRINSLLEPGGSLLINERGLVNGESYIIYPHENFRMFFAYDPYYGEVSRALRNRCVEFFIDGEYSLIDYSRISHFSKEEFEIIHQSSIGKAALCRELLGVLPRDETIKILYSADLVLSANEEPVVRSIKSFLQDSVQAYLAEDLSFYHFSCDQEGRECFLSGSCLADVETRCKLANSCSILPWVPKGNAYLPGLNIEDSLGLYLCVSNSTFKSGLYRNDDLCLLDLDSLQALWLVNRSKSQLAVSKFSKLFTGILSPVAYPLDKGLLSSYKSRRYSNNLPGLPDSPELLSLTEFYQLMSGKKLDFKSCRTLVKIIDDDSNELTIPILIDKSSFQNEERIYLQEVLDVYEQVLLKHLLDSIDRQQESRLNFTFYPQSYLKACWMMKQNCSLKEIILPILKIPSPDSADFLKVFIEMKQVSILEAPKFWTICSSMLKWPKVHGLTKLPEKYAKDLQSELEKYCKSDEKIEKLAKISQAASLGLWLYKLYIRMNKDPDVLFGDLQFDYKNLVEMIQKNIETRLDFHEFRMGFRWENSLVGFYKSCVGSLLSKLEKLSPCLRTVHRSSQAFINSLSSLPTYARLSSLLSQDFTQSSLSFLSDLLISILSSVSSHPTHLALPLTESLYLMLFGVHNQFNYSTTIFQFPVNLDDYSDKLVLSHLFNSKDFIHSITASVIKQTASVDLQTLHVSRVQRYSTEHNVGENTVEDNKKEKEVKESKQINKIFPTYKDQALFNQVCFKEKQEIVKLFTDWQFASGRLPSELESRYLSSLPHHFPGCYLQKPLEVHMKSYLKKYEEALTKFNFYKDPNPHESMQAYTPLVNLVKRLSDLSGDFEDHAVLQEVQHLCYKGLKRQIFSTPLAQMTAILEVIVQKAEDWENFAHSGISVKKEIADIYAVLRKWRELQMRSWENVLEETQNQIFEKEAKLWARLVRVLIVEKVGGKELFDVLDEFIRGSSLGVFEFRLNILQDFLKFAEENQVLPLYHIFQFYLSFKQQFKVIFDEQYKEIEARLKEILQIAKFKMSSYLTWKDSVGKIHKQLNTLVVKHKSILKLSFDTQVLKKHRDSYVVNVIEQPIVVFEDSCVLGNFEELSLQILNKIQELKGVEGKNDKKLALSDLFKELTTKGFSKYYKQSDLKVYELPRMDLFRDLADTSSHERYFYSCIDKMTVLQFSQTISQDLLYEEKDACLGFANSLMNELFRLRSSVYEELFNARSKRLVPDTLKEVLTKIQKVLHNIEFQAFQLGFDSNLAVKFKAPVLTGTWNDVLAVGTAVELVKQVREIEDEVKEQVFQLWTEMNRLVSQSIEQARIESLGQVGVDDELRLVLKFDSFSSDHMNTYRSLGKLAYILLSVFISLFTQGYCIPPELAEEDNSNEPGEGTGLGEGRGEKNITNELEDEEQFGEQAEEKEKNENSSEISEENQAMDVDNEFQEDQKEEAEDENSGDDKLEEAKGNEQLMDDSMEVDQDSEGRVRESANPDMAEDPEMTAGQLPEDRTGDVEDFDMQGKESSNEEMSEQDSDEIIEVDKVSQDEQMETDSEEENPEESKENKENKDQAERSEDNEELEQKSDKADLDSSEEEEEKKLDEFKNRDQVKYESKAFGNEDLRANTQKMLDGHENNSKQGEDQNIISRLKSEWSDSKGPSELGPRSAQAEAPTLQKVQVVHSNEEIKRPETSDLYTFVENSAEAAQAPSLEAKNQVLQDHLENPSKNETQIVDCAEELDLNALPSKALQDKQKAEERKDPQGAVRFVQFRDGDVAVWKQAGKSLSRDEAMEVDCELDVEMAIREEDAMAIDQVHLEDWLELERQTAQVSSELCEQLRIILEPTKAKSLKGDYKTGKRINMKKVIAYIASSYRKDKIWLRRTRQTAREYQVLLAIDDSFSMNQHGLGSIAVKGLAALAQALNKLEVGQLAVGAIRSGLTVLHDFSSLFLPESGAFVLSELKFNYGRERGNDTNYANFVTQTQIFLESRGSNDLQLVIVISDGRMNKDKVRPCLRKSDGIFYLFVIVDNQDSSIFDMKSTVITKKDGKSAVRVFPYLEDFPFEYYVVVQSAELIVAVIADVVKQWFELIRG